MCIYVPESMYVYHMHAWAKGCHKRSYPPELELQANVSSHVSARNLSDSQNLESPEGWASKNTVNDYFDYIVNWCWKTHFTVGKNIP